MNGKKFKKLIHDHLNIWWLKGLCPQDKDTLYRLVETIDSIDDALLITPSLLQNLVSIFLESATESLVVLAVESFQYTIYHYHAQIVFLLKSSTLLPSKLAQIFQFNKNEARCLYEFLFLAKLNGVKQDEAGFDLLYKATKSDLTNTSKAEYNHFIQHTHLDQVIDLPGRLDLKWLGFLHYYQLWTPLIDARLSKLKRSDLSLLFEHLNNFAKKNRLNESSFLQSIKLIEKKKQTIALSSVEKQSRKKTKLARSRISCQTFTLFLEHDKHKRYHSGQFGTVKRGYLTANSTNPIFAVKRYHPEKDVTPEQSTAECVAESKREVKYHQLLGEKAYCYSVNGKVFSVRPWRSGEVLVSLPSEVHPQRPMFHRLESLLVALKELQILHNHHRVHGDIKPGNLILNAKEKALHLIDFGSAHRNPYKDCYLMTREYSDPYRLSTGFADDIYALGYIVQELFPECFETDRLTMVDKLYKRAIQTLTEVMMGSREKRCLVGDIISFCNGLLAGIRNEDQLQTLLAKTIQRKELTDNDIYYGRLAF